MKTTPQAPEIFTRPLSSYNSAGLPPVGSPGHDEAVIAIVSLMYASKGWSAAVTVNDDTVRVVAVPGGGIQPVDYLEGLCSSGFIEDALPGLKTLYEMVDDPRTAYTYGLALSETGKLEECLAPLQKCLSMDPGHNHAAVAVGVALTKLKRHDEAEIVLRAAAAIQPDESLIQQNLAALLARAGKMNEALAYFRQAVKLAPGNPAPLMGLAQCLLELDTPTTKAEAMKVYKQVVTGHPNTDFAEAAKQTLNRHGQSQLRSAVNDMVRLDVVEYMTGAMKLFAALPKDQVGKIVLEIAKVGESGLAINEPSKRYKLKNLKGDFSGLQLLSYMHVGMKTFDPRVNTGSGLDREYEVAMGMAGK